MSDLLMSWIMQPQLIRDSWDRWCNIFPFMKTRPKAIRHKQTGLYAVQISNIMPGTNISNLLLKNINDPLSDKTQLDKALTWGKFLSTLSIFTRREIFLHGNVVNWRKNQKPVKNFSKMSKKFSKAKAY